MTYAYVRFSTGKQDETEQRHIVDEYARQHSLLVDEFVKDEGISGGVSYRDRNLYGLIKKLKPGDVLLTSEVSRLGRSMYDLNKLVNEELAPRKVRLIIIKMGLDIDCSNLNAMSQMILYSFGFAAQVEKELIQARTQAAIDARKKQIEVDGGFMSKTGNYITHLGAKVGSKNPTAVSAMAKSRTDRASAWKEDSPLYNWIIIQVIKGRPEDEVIAKARELYEKDPEKYCTRRGQALGKTTYRRYKSEILKKV